MGLPHENKYAKQYPTVDFDMNGPQVDELMNDHDSTPGAGDENLPTQEIIYNNKVWLDFDKSDGRLEMTQ